MSKCKCAGETPLTDSIQEAWILRSLSSQMKKLDWSNSQKVFDFVHSDLINLYVRETQDKDLPKMLKVMRSEPSASDVKSFREYLSALIEKDYMGSSKNDSP